MSIESDASAPGLENVCHNDLEGSKATLEFLRLSSPNMCVAWSIDEMPNLRTLVLWDTDRVWGVGVEAKKRNKRVRAPSIVLRTALSRMENGGNGEDLFEVLIADGMDDAAPRRATRADVPKKKEKKKRGGGGFDFDDFDDDMTHDMRLQDIECVEEDYEADFVLDEGEVAEGGWGFEGEEMED